MSHAINNVLIEYPIKSKQYASLLNRLYNGIHLLEWKRRYVNNDICDGTQWKIKITCDDGSHLDFLEAMSIHRTTRKCFLYSGHFSKKQVLRLKNDSCVLKMLCTDIRVPVEDADKAFTRAWNLIVGNGMRYVASFRELARDSENELIRYRAREMIRLLDRGGIREFDYGLCNQVLDHVEVTADGKLAVIFLTGTRMTI